MNVQTAKTLRTLSDTGKGRTFVVLREENAYAEFCENVSSALAVKTRVLQVATPQISDRNWESLATELRELLRAASIRQASFVTFGAACSLVEFLCLSDLKLARTLVFVDATSRPHPSLWSKLIERIERSLPLGLPLRIGSTALDAKPYLQRIRCPVLVVTSTVANEYTRAEAALFEARLPTSWILNLKSADQVAELSEQVLAFEEVPARCPQKNVSAAVHEVSAPRA